MLITWEVGTFTQSKFVHIQSCKKESTPLKSKVLSGVYQDIIKKSVFLLVKKKSKYNNVLHHVIYLFEFVE